jgi:hypothetical protein
LTRAEKQPWPSPELAAEAGLARYEYSFCSQNGEDGILRRIFDAIGYESRRFVEFGFHATQNNSIRLVLQENFSGLFIDGNPENAARFTRLAGRMSLQGVLAIAEFLDRDNLDRTIVRNGGGGTADFLSIDVDGNDYWLWKSLTSVKARVICIEYNAGFGDSHSLTVAYDDAFERYAMHPSGFYYGASLAALEKLGREKGYRLVGCDSAGINAFFVASDTGTDCLPTLSAQDAYRPHRNWLQRGFTREQQLQILLESGQPLVEV